MSRRVLLPLAVVLLLAVSPLPRAGEDPGDKVDPSQELGPPGLLPLSRILAAARRMVPGKVIDVELESDVGLDDNRRVTRWVYEVEILTASNQVVELEFDAKSGQLLEIDGAPWPPGEPRPKP